MFGFTKSFKFQVFQEIAQDFRAFMEGDPSVPKGFRGALEVALCAPGFHALLGHRIAHSLHRLGVPVLPRLISLLFRWWTGVEIHPGARIGKGILIDHGSGVVIGESAVVKDRCILFQGVTLGATGNERQWQRHPILEEGVVVGSGAKVLGPVRVGRGAKIGANAVVLSDVPPLATVVGPKAQVVKIKGSKARHTISQGTKALGSADPLEEALSRLGALEEEVHRLKRRLGQFERQERSEKTVEEVAI